MSNQKKFFNGVKGKDFPISFKSLTSSTIEYSNNDDEGYGLCLDVLPLFPYDKNGSKGTTQTGWIYRVYIPARSISVLVKVPDMQCAVEKPETLKTNPTTIHFVNFKASFYVNKGGFLELTCTADCAYVDKAGGHYEETM